MRPGRKLEPHQCHQDSSAHHPAGDEPGDRRVASRDGGEQARVRAGQHCGDDADHSGGRPEGRPVPAAQAQDGKPPRWRDADQVPSQFWREVEVVGPEPRDPFGVMQLFDRGLEHAVEGDEAKEGQRPQQYQAEGIERGADAGGRGDQPEGNKPGGYRADEDRCPAGRFGDRRGPCSLQGEMLGGDERDCARPRSRAACPRSRVLLATRRLTSFLACRMASDGIRLLR